MFSRSLHPSRVEVSFRSMRLVFRTRGSISGLPLRVRHWPVSAGVSSWVYSFHCELWYSPQTHGAYRESNQGPTLHLQSAAPMWNLPQASGSNLELNAGSTLGPVQFLRDNMARKCTFLKPVHLVSASLKSCLESVHFIFIIKANVRGQYYWSLKHDYFIFCYYFTFDVINKKVHSDDASKLEFLKFFFQIQIVWQVIIFFFLITWIISDFSHFPPQN